MSMSWIKKSLKGSTTMPLGTGGGSVLTGSHLHTHHHHHDGSCCGHDHSHDHHHHHHDEDEDCTNPKGSCC